MNEISYKIIHWQAGTTPEGKAIRASQAFAFRRDEIYLAAATRRCKDWLEQNRSESWSKGIKTLLIEHCKAEPPKKMDKGFPTVFFVEEPAPVLWVFGDDDECWFYHKETCPKPEKRTKGVLFDLLKENSAIKESAKAQRLSKDGGWIPLQSIFIK